MAARLLREPVLGRWRESLALLIPERLDRPAREDLIAGLTVAVVALPLAIAFGVASGASPAAGLYAAIFGGLTASLFGSSPLNISGPTGAMTVVLVEIVREHGATGMALAGLMAGLMQILLGMARAGRFVKFLPHSLIAGFTTGIAVVIFRGQLPPFSEGVVAGAVTIIAMVTTLWLWPKGPAAPIGLAAGIVANLAFPGPVVTNVPQGLPVPSLPAPSPAMLASAFSAGVTICVLGSIEGLLTASLVDSMKRTRHDSNRELVGQGVANVVSALMGGVPVTGAVARTGVAVRGGGRTRWTGILHSLFLLMAVVALAPLARFIPMASLAGILMVTSFRMVEWQSLRLIPQAAPHYNAVLLTTLFLTIFADLTVAVGVGFTLATFLFMNKLSHAPLREADVVLPRELAGQVAVHVLNSPLFFAVTRSTLDRLEGEGKRILVLDMHRVPLVDATGAMMLQELGESLHARGGGLIVWGLEPELEEALARYSPRRWERRYGVVRRSTTLEDAVRALLQGVDRLGGADAIEGAGGASRAPAEAPAAALNLARQGAAPGGGQ